MNNSSNHSRSQELRNQIRDDFPSLETWQQEEFSRHAQSAAAINKRNVFGLLCVNAKFLVRRMLRTTLGDAESGPAYIVKQILDTLVRASGHKPHTRPGQVVRQFLASVWTLLCVVMVANFAQADQRNISIHAWSVEYGALGVAYLLLWIILVMDIWRQKRRWIEATRILESLPRSE
jgi:hypothetical protein